MRGNDKSWHRRNKKGNSLTDFCCYELVCVSSPLSKRAPHKPVTARAHLQNSTIEMPPPSYLRSSGSRRCLKPLSQFTDTNTHPSNAPLIIIENSYRGNWAEPLLMAYWVPNCERSDAFKREGETVLLLPPLEKYNLAHLFGYICEVVLHKRLGGEERWQLVTTLYFHWRAQNNINLFL